MAAIVSIAHPPTSQHHPWSTRNRTRRRSKARSGLALHQAPDRTGPIPDILVSSGVPRLRRAARPDGRHPPVARAAVAAIIPARCKFSHADLPTRSLILRTDRSKSLVRVADTSKRSGSRWRNKPANFRHGLFWFAIGILVPPGPLPRRSCTFGQSAPCLLPLPLPPAGGRGWRHMRPAMTIGVLLVLPSSRTQNQRIRIVET